MKSIETDDIIEILNYKELIFELKKAFQSSEYSIHERQHLKLSDENIALIMPAWNKQFYGIKHIMAYPGNGRLNMATIQGTYDLYDVSNGLKVANINAAKLTGIRTAATSVLAASFIKKDPKKLIIMGAGVVGEHLVEAYCSYYNLSEVIIWNRNISKAKLLAEKFNHKFPVSVSSDIIKDVKNADIISCATHSYSPILKGEWLNNHPHIDLIGSYKPEMREVDDKVIANADIYIDSEKALEESGDLYIPIKEGIIKNKAIKGTLFQLCQGEIMHIDNGSKTVFKSVGHAIEDLAAAIYLFEKIKLNA